jgi:hypothetical protein
MRILVQLCSAFPVYAMLKVMVDNPDWLLRSINTSCHPRSQYCEATMNLPVFHPITRLCCLIVAISSFCELNQTVTSRTYFNLKHIIRGYQAPPNARRIKMRRSEGLLGRDDLADEVGDRLGECWSTPRGAIFVRYIARCVKKPLVKKPRVKKPQQIYGTVRADFETGVDRVTFFTTLTHSNDTRS